MSWATVALLGAMLGGWLKRWVWKRSHGGIMGWFRRRRYDLKMRWRRWKFRRKMNAG